MGLVKNRCKNGDHCWVDAYVTPICEGTKVVGYESVRVKPSRAQVKRAEQVYQRLSAGQPWVISIEIIRQKYQQVTFQSVLLATVLAGVATVLYGGVMATLTFLFIGLFVPPLIRLSQPFNAEVQQAKKMLAMRWRNIFIRVI